MYHLSKVSIQSIDYNDISVNDIQAYSQLHLLNGIGIMNGGIIIKGGTPPAGMLPHGGALPPASPPGGAVAGVLGVAGAAGVPEKQINLHLIYTIYLFSVDV